jgi:hypothetical protein
MGYYNSYRYRPSFRTVPYNNTQQFSFDEKDLTDPNLLTRIQNIRNEPTITEWEKNFLESIDNYFGSKNRLSQGQYNTFKKIEMRYDSEVKAAREEFANTFTDQMRRNMHIVASVYKESNSPYYKELVKNILDDNKFIPTQEQWNKFMNNKYAKGYLDNFNSEPKFKVGDTVCPSSSDKTERYNTALVVDNEGIFPITHASGGKRYMILPYGQTNTLIVEERQLKFKR